MTQSEVILNGLRKDARGTTYSRQLRPRPARVSIAKVRTVPGRDSFDGVEPTEAVRQMELAKKCGFNRVMVAPSTIAGAGLGLFLRQERIRAGGLVTSYEGERLTQAQVDEEGRDLSYVYCSGEGPDGKMRYVDALALYSC